MAAVHAMIVSSISETYTKSMKRIPNFTAIPTFSASDNSSPYPLQAESCSCVSKVMAKQIMIGVSGRRRNGSAGRSVLLCSALQQDPASSEGGKEVIRKLYGNPFSPPAMRVALCLEEKCLDYKFVAVDMRSGAHKKESFLAMNPFGKVPVYEDGEIVLFESRACTKFIASKYKDNGTDLIGKTLAESAAVEVWMEVESHQFDPVASKVMGELLFKPMFLGTQPDENVVVENLTKLGKVLDVYEAKLAKTKFLAASEFSLADLHHMPTIHVLYKIPRAVEVFNTRELVKVWVADISARPAWLKIVETHKF